METFASHLITIFAPHPDILDQEHIRQVENSLLVPLQLSFPPKAINPTEVENIIIQLPKKKAPGYDLITSEILRHLPKKALIFLTQIYNAVLRTTYYPALWKFTNIVMIPKPNKPTHIPSSYRPIGLLPVMGKILEKLLLSRLIPILESQNIIPDHQFGFRSHHSTT